MDLWSDEEGEQLLQLQRQEDYEIYCYLHDLDKAADGLQQVPLASVDEPKIANCSASGMTSYSQNPFLSQAPNTSPQSVTEFVNDDETTDEQIQPCEELDIMFNAVEEETEQTKETEQTRGTEQSIETKHIWKTLIDAVSDWLRIKHQNNPEQFQTHFEIVQNKKYTMWSNSNEFYHIKASMPFKIRPKQTYAEGECAVLAYLQRVSSDYADVPVNQGCQNKQHKHEIRHPQHKNHVLQLWKEEGAVYLSEENSRFGAFKMLTGGELELVFTCFDSCQTNRNGN